MFKMSIDHLEPTDLMNLSVTSTVKSRRHLMIPKRITRKANQARIMKVPAEHRLPSLYCPVIYCESNCKFVSSSYC